MPSTTSKTTTDHATIRRWAEARKARPTAVARTRAKSDGVIRLDLPGISGAKELASITWDEFFEKFEDEGLAFVYQDKTASGRPSNVNRFVKRTPGLAKATARKPAPAARAAPKRSAAKRPAKRVARATKKSAGQKRGGARTRTTRARSRA